MWQKYEGKKKEKIFSASEPSLALLALINMNGPLWPYNGVLIPCPYWGAGESKHYSHSSPCSFLPFIIQWGGKCC